MHYYILLKDGLTIPKRQTLKLKIEHYFTCWQSFVTYLVQNCLWFNVYWYFMFHSHYNLTGVTISDHFQLSEWSPQTPQPPDQVFWSVAPWLSLGSEFQQFSYLPLASYEQPVIVKHLWNCIEIDNFEVQKNHTTWF